MKFCAICEENIKKMFEQSEHPKLKAILFLAMNEFPLKSLQQLSVVISEQLCNIKAKAVEKTILYLMQEGYLAETINEDGNVITMAMNEHFSVIEHYKKFPENKLCRRCGINRYKEFKAKNGVRSKVMERKISELQIASQMIECMSGIHNISEMIRMFRAQCGFGYIKAHQIIQELKNMGLIIIRRTGKNEKILSFAYIPQQALPEKEELRNKIC